MRRALFTILFALWAQVASAGINCSLPFTLTNGTTADATQVMANYNALVTCLQSAAGAGANTDITSILGLTTPLSPSQGGTWVRTSLAGSTSFSSNVYTITGLVPGSFTLTAGSIIYFVVPAGGTNTGSVTWNVQGTGAVNVVKHVATGTSALSGGEIVQNQVTVGFYDGTNWQLLDAAPATGFVQPCTVIDVAGINVPTGYLFANGAAVSRTTFSNLFSCITNTAVAATTASGNVNVTVNTGTANQYQPGWFVGGPNVTCNSVITSIPTSSIIAINPAPGANGATTLTIGPYLQGDCSTTFNTPNLSGRATVMADVNGGLLQAAACSNAASVGSQCGSTTQQITASSLPAYTPSGSVSITNVSVTYPVRQFATSGSTVFTDISLASNIASSAGTLSATFGSGTATFSGSAQGGTNTPILLQPIGLVYKAIKF